MILYTATRTQYQPLAACHHTSTGFADTILNFISHIKLSKMERPWNNPFLWIQCRNSIYQSVSSEWHATSGCWPAVHPDTKCFVAWFEGPLFSGLVWVELQLLFVLGFISSYCWWKDAWQFYLRMGKLPKPKGSCSNPNSRNTPPTRLTQSQQCLSRWPFVSHIQTGYPAVLTVDKLYSLLHWVAEPLVQSRVWLGLMCSHCTTYRSILSIRPWNRNK